MTIVLFLLIFIVGYCLCVRWFNILDDFIHPKYGYAFWVQVTTFIGVIVCIILALIWFLGILALIGLWTWELIRRDPQRL